MSENKQRVAIVGAGLSGLTCGRSLSEQGYSVSIFDKGRGVSGRMSTRRASLNSTADSLQFDHGAQYFTARDDRFKNQIDRWRSLRVVQEWEGPFVTLEAGQTSEAPGKDKRYVAVPGMNALCRDLAKTQSVQCSERISQLKRIDNQWRLQSENLSTSATKQIQESFAAVVLTIPPFQAQQLLTRNSSLFAKCSDVQMSPCRCVMVAFAERIDVPFNAAFVQNSPLRWIARDSSKPGRNSSAECWVLHASPEWSSAHVEDENETVLPELLNAFAHDLGISLPEVIHSAGHRWLYAIPENPLAAGALVDSEDRLVVCGDWCHEARVEGAYLSGLTAAEAVHKMLR